jgi:hypothetical protein
MGFKAQMYLMAGLVFQSGFGGNVTPALWIIRDVFIISLYSFNKS